MPYNEAVSLKKGGIDMKIFTKRDKRSSIDKEIERVILEMSLLEANSDEYKEMAGNLELLMKGKSYNKENTKISKDVIVTGMFSILSIVIIVGYEQFNVLTSKALGFVPKGRV